MDMKDKSLFHFMLGDFKCLAIRDGGHRGSADILFINVPKGELDTALRAHNLKQDQFWSTWTCLLIDTGNVKLLVDTGIGGGNPNGGQLLPRLEQVGVQPVDIDMVFITHGHADHLGGCIGSDGKPVFPKARYIIDKRELNFWMGEEHKDDMLFRMAEFARPKLAAIGDQLELIEPDTEITPGVRTIASYGHTPGHSGLEIRSQNETLFNLSDSVLHPLHLEHPEWYSRVDVSPELMITTRMHLLKRAVREQALVLFFHFEFPGLGYLEHTGDQWHWQAI